MSLFDGLELFSSQILSYSESFLVIFILFIKNFFPIGRHLIMKPLFFVLDLSHQTILPLQDKLVLLFQNMLGLCFLLLISNFL